MATENKIVGRIVTKKKKVKHWLHIPIAFLIFPWWIVYFFLCVEAWHFNRNNSDKFIYEQ